MLNSLSPDHITVDEIAGRYPPDIRVSVLRLDKLHPVISGNKWFKLRFYLEEAISQQKKGLLTFGGAWSNHIVATAAVCRENGLHSIGIIRGEEPAEWSQALLDAKKEGMQLHFISRTDYKEKHVPGELNISSRDYILVPEGGYGAAGVKGAATIAAIPAQIYSHYLCMAGTGTMTAGLINALPESSTVISISAMKNNHSLQEQISFQLAPVHADWTLLHDHHEGGYARFTPSLLRFMNDFYAETGIPTDFVYTAKLFRAVDDLVSRSFFPSGSRLLVIHSGGLQGNRSLPKGTLNF
ncbi:pyridoxal-phosphate dependent enzyme [Terrimonas sp. NA20]|uniref:Pyridoxal-phosphate dependent enzyme n=1 Tax=Terrimonas ginsenosidimutans TaxID=2908004 RepID=A0ABS9KTI1_9BACT|nr:pyridoxal-phosphate dependent enzyme [Terrimonas ginsenosidimutans]MCG2615594.1 pyridoxal-phosphate dependent enzyme [Terrimonas ginsenosidimutans]